MRDLGVALVGGGVLAAGAGLLLIAWWVVHDPVLLYSIVYGLLAIAGLFALALACLAVRWVLEAAMAYMHRENERSVVTGRIGALTPGMPAPAGYLPSIQASTPHRVEGQDVVDVIPGKSGQGVGTTILGWPDEGGTV